MPQAGQVKHSPLKSVFKMLVLLFVVTVQLQRPELVLIPLIIRELMNISAFIIIRVNETKQR